MNTRSTTVALVALAIASTTTAQVIKPYVSLSGGVAILNADYRDDTSSDGNGGGVVEGAVGLAYRENEDAMGLRAELALSHQYNDISGEDFNVDISALMVNAYWDIFTETLVTPYLLAGGGVARIDEDASGSDKSGNVGAYQVGGGLGFSLTDHLVLDLKYKCFMTADYTKEGSSVRFFSHQVQLGVRYQF